MEPGRTFEDIYTTCEIGCYFEDIANRHPVDPRQVPLGQVAADILGIPHVEDRPELRFTPGPPAVTAPYVCIATASTAKCKLWNRENGWQEVVDHLVRADLRTVVVQKEPTNLSGVVDRTGDRPLADRINEIRHCRFFIGLGSGLSWLAWAMVHPVVLISGFSLPFTEFRDGCERVINTDVCLGCWTDTGFVFERGDWYWCPRLGDTDQAFECTTVISESRVITAINRLIERIS